MRNFIILAFLLFILASGCTERVEIPDEASTQIDIYYSFGVFENNTLDTKNNLYVKDMVADPPIEYTMQLSDAEKMEIYQSVLDNDFFNIKNEFTENCNLIGICQTVTPLSKSTITITIEGNVKTVKASADYFDKNDPDYKKFRNVEQVIYNIIIKKENELNIPQPTSGYI